MKESTATKQYMKCKKMKASVYFHAYRPIYTVGENINSKVL